jgi:hypothetical protein
MKKVLQTVLDINGILSIACMIALGIVATRNEQYHINR